jgi:AraC-like DNA-binding protein
VTFTLSRFVEHVRVMAPVDGRFDFSRLPDGRTTVYFRQMANGTIDLTVGGPRTRAHSKHGSGLVRLVALQLKPGWSTPVIGIATSALTDRMVYLEEVWGRVGSDLRDQLAAARDVSEIVERMSNAIASRGEIESASARLARRAVRLLEADKVRVERVAEQLGVSARHLRRAFTESIGIGPKEYVRTVRLQRAVQMATKSRDWVRIAAAAGYYDQAHLIGDFHDLVGVTPSAYIKRA